MDKDVQLVARQKFPPIQSQRNEQFQSQARFQFAKFVIWHRVESRSSECRTGDDGTNGLVGAIFNFEWKPERKCSFNAENSNRIKSFMGTNSARYYISSKQRLVIGCFRSGKSGTNGSQADYALGTTDPALSS